MFSPGSRYQQVLHTPIQAVPQEFRISSHQILMSFVPSYVLTFCSYYVCVPFWKPFLIVADTNFYSVLFCRILAYVLLIDIEQQFRNCLKIRRKLRLISKNTPYYPGRLINRVAHDTLLVPAVSLTSFSQLLSNALLAFIEYRYMV